MKYSYKERDAHMRKSARVAAQRSSSIINGVVCRHCITADHARALTAAHKLHSTAEFNALASVFKVLGDDTPVCLAVPELDDLLCTGSLAAGQALAPEGKLLAMYPSTKFPGQITRLVAAPDGRFREIAAKAGKAYRLIAKLAGEDVSDSSVAAFAEAFAAANTPVQFFLSESGDRERLIYAYRNWGSLAHSCMAGGNATPSPELRNGDGGYSRMLEDHLANIDELRVAMLHTATGEVLARCLVRRVYSDHDRDSEYIGEFIDRRYAVTDALGDALVEQIKRAVNNVIGVRGNGGAGDSTSAWEIADVDACDPYIKLKPNCEDDAMAAYQDTFKCYEDERAYYREARDRREIKYEMLWDEAELRCECCGREVLEDERVWGPDGQIWCDRDCAHNCGWVVCSRCGDWVGIDEAIAVNDEFYCEERCATRAGLVKCAVCGGWAANDAVIVIGENAFCGKDCAEEAGFARCVGCGDWYAVNDGDAAVDGGYCGVDCARRNDTLTAETEAQNEANEESGVAA